MKICTERTRWFRLNQDELRAETYHGLKKVIQKAGVDLKEIGTRVILPAGFSCGKRYWHGK